MSRVFAGTHTFTLDALCVWGGAAVVFWLLQEEHQDEDAGVRHGQSSRRAYFRELKKVTHILVFGVVVIVVVVFVLLSLFVLYLAGQ